MNEYDRFEDPDNLKETPGQPEVPQAPTKLPGKTAGEMAAEVHGRMSMFAPQVSLQEFWSIVSDGLDIKPGDIFNPETDAKFAGRLREFNEAAKNVAFIKLNVNDPGKVATYLVQAGKERLLVQLWFAAHKASLRPSANKAAKTGA